MNKRAIDIISASLKNSPEILGKDKYFNSAVLVPLFEKNAELHVLFEKRANAIRQGGEVSFPGGEFDPEKDSTLEQTAIRETVEELKIGTEKIKMLGKVGTLIAPMGVTVDAYAASLIVEDLSLIDFDMTEVDKVFSIPIDYFLENKPEEYTVRLEVHPNHVDSSGNKIELLPVARLGLPERYARPWKNGKHKVLVYNTSEEIIWGITAEIIYEFSKLIAGIK